MPTPVAPCRRCSPSLQKLRHCVAGASVVMVGRVDGAIRWRRSFFFRAWVEGRATVDDDEWNVGSCRGWNEGQERGAHSLGECFFGEDGPGSCCWQQWLLSSGIVSGRGLLVVIVSAVFVIFFTRAMWNWNRGSVAMRKMDQVEVDRGVVDLISNCVSSNAGLVRTVICFGGCTKVISSADHGNTTDLIMERYVTDLCCPGNDVTISCSSAKLKYASAGREWQQIAMQKEGPLYASSLLQNFRRSFILMLIIESRVGLDHLYDPKIYPATFKLINV